jgi:hypothetical protein
MALKDDEVFELIKLLKEGINNNKDSGFTLTNVKVMLSNGTVYEVNLEDNAPRVVH